MKYYSHYKKWHDHNDDHYVKYMKRKLRNTFGNDLPLNKDAAILEIGCANGMALLTLKDQGYSNLLGIEIDVDLANIAQSFDLNIKNDDAIKFVAETKRKFDFIYMFDVLEHFNTNAIPGFLSRLFNILNENGKLMLVVPNATSPAGSHFRYIDWTHKVSFTSTSISHLLEESGFKEIVIKDESLIPIPDIEEYDNKYHFDNAKQLSDRARFHESFVRWEMMSMFGDSPYNLLVAPNMKVVACKKNNEVLDLKIIVKDDVLDLKGLVNNVFENTNKLGQIQVKLGILESEVRSENKSISNIRKNLDDFKLKTRDQLLELIKEYEDLLRRREIEVQLLNNQISSIHEKMELTSKLQNLESIQIKKIIDKNETKTHLLNKANETLETNLLNFYKYMYKKKKGKFKKIFSVFRLTKLKRAIQKSALFDTDYYLGNNPDVRRSGVDPIIHYLTHGAYEGRNPSPNFDTDQYILSNPEIIIHDINPLIHKINLS